MGAAVFAQLIGSLLQNGQMQQALAMRQEASNLFGVEFLPKLDSMVALHLPQSEIDAWTKATAATQGQGQALGALEQEVSAKGETPEDKAAFLNARQNASNFASSANAGALRALASRGMAGSGLAMGAGEAAGQAASNQANTADVNEAGAARQRYLQSVAQLASTSGQMRSQDQAALSAQDALNEYNLNNSMAAQQFNLNLPLQVFNARMALAQGKASALGGVANQFNNIGQTYANQGGAIAHGLVTNAQQQPNAMEDPSANPYGPGGGAPNYTPPKNSSAPTPNDPEYWSGYGSSAA